MVEYILLKCFSDSCGMYQVIQRNKTNKFSCKVCNSKQSVKKVFAVSYKAKDLRDLCMTYNMEKGNETQQKAKEKRHLEEARESAGGQSYDDYEEPLDVKANPPNKKSKWTIYEESKHDEEEEEEEEAGFVLIKPDAPKRNSRKSQAAPAKTSKTAPSKTGKFEKPEKSNFDYGDDADSYLDFFDAPQKPQHINNININKNMPLQNKNTNTNTNTNNINKVQQQPIMNKNVTQPSKPFAAPTQNNEQKTNYSNMLNNTNNVTHKTTAKPNYSSMFGTNNITQQTQNIQKPQNNEQTSKTTANVQKPNYSNMFNNSNNVTQNQTKQNTITNTQTNPLASLPKREINNNSTTNNISTKQNTIQNIQKNNPLANLPKKPLDAGGASSSKWSQYTEDTNSDEEEDDLLWNGGAVNEVLEERV